MKKYDQCLENLSRFVTIFQNRIGRGYGFLCIIFFLWAVQYYSMLILLKVESK